MAALVPHLRVIELPHKTVLFEAGDTIKALYFPHNGMVSIVVDLSSGETIEAATIGRDGLVGGQPLLMMILPLTGPSSRSKAWLRLWTSAHSAHSYNKAILCTPLLRATDSLFWHKHSNPQPARPLTR
jgi:CRP-like cAMP-binding protein